MSTAGSSYEDLLKGINSLKTFSASKEDLFIRHLKWSFNSPFMIQQAYDLATFKPEKKSCLSGEIDSGNWKGALSRLLGPVTRPCYIDQ